MLFPKMPDLTGFSLRIKISAMICLSLAVTIGWITAELSMLQTRHTQQETLRDIRNAVKMAVYAIEKSGEAVKSGNDAQGDVAKIVWRNMPDAFSETTLDEIADHIHADLTIYRLGSDGVSFAPVTTTLLNAEGMRDAGQLLANDPALTEAIANGAPQFIAFNDKSTDFKSAIYPLLSAEGEIAGALLLQIDLSALSAARRDFLQHAGFVALVTIALALGLCFVGVRYLLRPLQKLSGDMVEISQGNLSVEPRVQNSRDEIGAISRSLSSLRDKLIELRTVEDEKSLQAEVLARQRGDQERVVRDITAGLERLAQGDLTQLLEDSADNPFPADYTVLRESFNGVLTQLDGVFIRIRDIAEGVRGGSQEIAQVSQDISSRAETQAATLEQSAAALNELTESVRSTAERAAQARRASQDNRENAAEGASVVRDAISAMAMIEKSASQITRIISVIEDIAFQTNLLALNAGVEAARAGEAGRGFSVVAQEVRLLAQRASDSAREIRALISDSSAQVENGSQLVNKTGDSLDEILAKAAETASLASDIAVAAAEQATGLDEVNSGVNQLDQVTQQNAAIAEETTAAAASLLQKSDDLVRALDGFRTSSRKSTAFSPVPQQPVTKKQATNPVSNDWAAAARNAITQDPLIADSKAQANAKWVDF